MAEFKTNVDYDIYVLDDSFTRLAMLPGFHSIRYVKVANSVGAFTLEFPDLDAELLAVDRIVEIWRRAYDVPAQRVFSGFLRKWYPATGAGNVHVMTLVGEGFSRLLRSHIVAYHANTPQAQKAGYADDLMKAVVRENLGALAVDADRDLTSLGFRVQADAGAGPDVAKSFEWREVLDALQTLAEEAAYDQEVFFDIVHDGAAGLEFRTWVGQRGLDRTSGAGVAYFGLEYGNLHEPKLITDHSREGNYAYVGGQGTGEDMVVEEVSDDARIGASAWNRCEMYVRSTSDNAEASLQSAGEAALAKGAPLKRITGGLLDTKLSRWGRDWDFGDRVLVSYEGEYLPVVIRTLDVRVDARGNEVVKGTLDNSVGLHPPDEFAPAVLHEIRSLRKAAVPGATGGFYIDFTGTQYDTVAKCNKAGLRFSDVDTPFPTTLSYAVGGSWAHVAGRGWEPSSSVTNEGPAILWPMEQASEWEMEIELDLTETAVAYKSYCDIGHVDNSNHAGAFAMLLSTLAVSTTVEARLYTNDGDDTFTSRYTGSQTVGALGYTLKYRNKNGALSVWDFEDEAWHDYDGRASAGISFGAANGFVHIRKISGSTLDVVYVKSLRVRYLSRSG